MQIQISTFRHITHALTQSFGHVLKERCQSCTVALCSWDLGVLLQGTLGKCTGTFPVTSPFFPLWSISELEPETVLYSNQVYPYTAIAAPQMTTLYPYHFYLPENTAF